jgi:hypothetical protein
LQVPPFSFVFDKKAPPMKPSQVFGIVVRTFGLLFSLYGIWYLVYGVATTLGLPEDQPGYEESYYLSGIISLAAGLYLLRGAPFLMRFSYPHCGEVSKNEVLEHGLDCQDAQG